MGRGNEEVSMNGVVAVISMDNGKVVDAEVPSRHCRQCSIKRRFCKDDTEFNAWFSDHQSQCGLNHDGTAPAIEAEGARRIFGRSVAERGARYTEYFGDGDSKGFATVKNIYPGIEVNKEECKVHYQKRVGNRLLKLKKENKGLKDLTKLFWDCLTIALYICCRYVDGNPCKFFAYCKFSK